MRSTSSFQPITSKVLIVGDPVGSHTLRLLKIGFKPENIWVWEDNEAHIYAIRQQHAKINIVKDLDLLIQQKMRFTMAIGNPPYGVGGNLAIKFLNKTSQLTDDIRFVLPTSVRKPSSLNKISPNLHCVVDEDLNSSTFPGGISAVKQHWVVKEEKREKIFMHTSHPDFEFLSYERRFDADVFIGEYGCGPSGRVKTENFTHYAKGHHFIKVRDPQVIENFLEFADRFREVANQCNGRYHFGKNDLISTYIKCLEEKNEQE
jgi:hypothetical protein